MEEVQADDAGRPGATKPGAKPAVKRAAPAAKPAPAGALKD
jgi:hypothetical protein